MCVIIDKGMWIWQVLWSIGYEEEWVLYKDKWGWVFSRSIKYSSLKLSTLIIIIYMISYTNLYYIYT